jgi:hypothetical protein
MAHFSFQAVNVPGHFIRHRDFLGEISAISETSPELDRKDATFSLLDNPAGNPPAVQLEATNVFAHVLRHQNFRVKLHEYNPPLIPPGGHETPELELLRKDSTFHLVPGLADPNGVSFRSLNFPDRFLRHRDFHLLVERITNDDDLGRHDATFIKRSPLFPPEPDPPGPH